MAWLANHTGAIVGLLSLAILSVVSMNISLFVMMFGLFYVFWLFAKIFYLSTRWVFRRTTERREKVVKAYASLALTIALMFIAYHGQDYQSHIVRENMQYVINRVEEHKKATGQYPRAYADLKEQPKACGPFINTPVWYTYDQEKDTYGVHCWMAMFMFNNYHSERGWAVTD